MVRFIKGVGLAALIASSTASAEVMLGAYVPGDGFWRSEIVNYNSVMPKPLAFVNLFTSFSHDWDHLYWQTSNIVEEGAMPMISWMPVDLDRPSENILAEIALGLHDDYIDTWAQRLLAWIAQYPAGEQPTILLRFGHEFNGNWYAYGNSPFFFQSAWQYIHEKFEAAGANEHVEWVWSANNVSVDDFDDITAYYPGSSYVDWTSIDGYNFGSNYSWTSWESFSEVYSDTYLTLVDTFPEKPILIAEIGSAEEQDVPSWYWGQFGDDSDVVESKEEWVADFLAQLESNFPAVRAVSWFNTNKELGWSLTHEGNTGYNAYQAAVQSDYFTADFLSAPAQQDTVDPALEAARIQAQTAYDQAQSNYEAAETQLAQALIFLSDTEINRDSLLSQRSEAWAARQSALATYRNARELYLGKHRIYIEEREKYRGRRLAMLELRQQYFDQHQQYQNALSTRRNAQAVYGNSRQQYVNGRQLFRDAFADFKEALTIWTERDQTGDTDAQRAEFDKAKDIYIEARDTFFLQRSEFFSSLAHYRGVSEDFRAALEKRKNALLSYRESSQVLKRMGGELSVVAEGRRAKYDVFRSTRDVYLDRHSAYKEIDESYKASLAMVTVAGNEVDEAQSYLLEATTARSDAYTALINSQHLISMEGQSATQGLMLADGGNEKKVDAASKAKGNGVSENTDAEVTAEAKKDNSANKNKAVAFEKKKLAKKVKLDKNAQRMLAQSRRPDSVDPAKIKERKEKYKNMSADEKEALKLQKLTVLNY